MKTIIERVDFLLSMIHNGVRDKDKEQVTTHLEDLNYLLQEKNLIAEY